MSIPKPILVTERELITRIDHKLAASGMALCRKPHPMGTESAGPVHFDMIEVATNHLVRPDVQLESLAREIGALADGEVLKA